MVVYDIHLDYDVQHYLVCSGKNVFKSFFTEQIWIGEDGLVDFHHSVCMQLESLFVIVR